MVPSGRNQGNMQLRNVRFIVQNSPAIQIVSISKVSKSVVACHPACDDEMCWFFCGCYDLLIQVCKMIQKIVACDDAMCWFFCGCYDLL